MESKGKKKKKENLFFLLALFGSLYLFLYFYSPSLSFHELFISSSSSLIHQLPRHGFVHVSPWMESTSTHSFSQVKEVFELLSSSSSSEIQKQKLNFFQVFWIHFFKWLFQSTLCLFQLVTWKKFSVAKSSRKRLVLTMLCSFLDFFCWFLIQKALEKLLISKEQSNQLIFQVLFFVRWTCCLAFHLEMARKYQQYFVHSFPSKWKEIPRFIGSKDLIMTTLYGAVAFVILLALFSINFRALIEAALFLQVLAIGSSLVHAVASHYAAFFESNSVNKME